MIEVFGDIWAYEADAKVITTNGYVKVNGKAVMGRGVAKQAVYRFPKFPDLLGHKLMEHGNHVYMFYHLASDQTFFTLPVKHNWNEPADLRLIERSSIELLGAVNTHSISIVVVPRPGCGNGQLDWNEVKQVLRLYWDDRFHVITNEKGM